VPDTSTWVEPSVGSTAAFLGVVGLVLALFVWGVARVSERKGRAAGWASLACAGWLAITGAYVAFGVTGTGVPGLMGFFLGANLTGLLFAFSPLGTRLIDGLPLWTLAAFQAFRLPLELVLHQWSDEGALPIQMTFEGHNFDIVTGVLGVAVLVAALTLKEVPRAALWAFNVVGSALLLAVIVIVVLSSPLPVKSYEGPPILLALFLPYAWIAPVCVAGALSAHVMLWRALLRGAKSEL